MLEASQLTKVYGSGLAALDRLNLRIPPGEVFCLLGPNGAGKTTTIHLFLDFISPTSGRAIVSGIESRVDPLGARRKLAYIPENVTLYGRLTGLENLEYFVSLATGWRLGARELKGLLDKAGLPAEAMGRKVAGYSKGMRQKVGIAIALAKRAEALLLDEPTSGLDPLAANEFARLVEGVRADGMAVLMVTHDLFLAQRCAGRVGIMRNGRLATTIDTAATDHPGLERAYLEASKSMEAA